MNNAIKFKAQRGENKPKYIYNGGLVNGYVCYATSVGIGEPEQVWDGLDGVDTVYKDYKTIMSPFFNGATCKSTPDEIKKIFGNPVDIQKVLGTEYEQYLVRVGENAGGLVVTRIEEEKSVQKEPEVPEITNFYNGIFGLRISQRLPKAMWNLVKPYAEYHDGGDADMENADDMGYLNVEKYEIVGWYYSREAVDALIKAGYKCSYQGEPITIDFQTTANIVAEKRKAKQAERAAREAYLKGVKKLLYEVWHDDEYMTEQQVAEVMATLRMEITCPKIDIEGHDIYGGGLYLSQDDNYLYFVKNNGMDGDDWSRNNYPTGGAGAIVTRVLKSEKTEQLLNEIKKLNDEKN